MTTAALALTVSMPSVPQWTIALSRYRADIADWVPFWRDRFAPAFYREILENFISEGGSTGSRWAPLSPQYAAWKARRFPEAYGILTRSSQLKASLLGPGAPNAVFRPTSTGLEMGTSVPWAAYHQRGNRRLPQRPPLRVSGPFMTVMGKAMQQFVQQAWTNARRGFSSVTVAGPITAAGAGGGGLL